MKPLALFRFVVFLASGLSAQDSLAEDYTRLNLPEGALARLGKGRISSADRPVAYSPDGSRLAVATNIGIWLYDAATGGEVALFTGHTGGVNSVAFSPDGITLASAGWDGTVRLWEVASGRETAVLGHREAVESVFFSPDGTTLASGSEDGTVRLWEVASGRKTAVLGRPKSSPTDVAAVFSPDGTTLASFREYEKTVRLWDVASGRQTAVLEGHVNPVHSVSFSPDGTTLASTDGGVMIRLWDVAGGREAAVLRGYTRGVSPVLFSPDGTTLASGSGDGTVRLWEVDSAQEKAVLEGHTEGVHSLLFSPDGTTLASAGRDGTVRLWEVASAQEKAVLKGHTDWIYSMSFSPDGTALASAGRDGTVRLWEVDSGRETAVLEGHGVWSVYSVSFSPDGTTLASGSGDGTILLWDMTGAATAIHTPATEQTPSAAVGDTAGAGSSGQSLDEANVYWTQPSTGTIKRAVVSGAGLVDVETIVASRGLDHPESLALDVNDGRIYWTDWSMGRIMRGNAALDGTGVETLVTGLRQPTGLALDVAGGRMYWIDSGRGRIQRGSLDGTDVETLVTGVGAQGLALDPMSDLMYWTEPGAGKIRRASLSGAGVETLLSELDEPGNLALHADEARIYWIERSDESWTRPGIIRRASLDGTRVETILPDLDNPVDLSLHLAEGRIYWLESDRDLCCTPVSHSSKLRRADLDGANVETFFVPGRFGQVPRGMALDVEGGKTYWSYLSQVHRSGTIRAVDLDGTNERGLPSPERDHDFPPGLPKPLVIALSAPEERIYWMDRDAIHRASLDGTSIQALVTGLDAPTSLALDLAGGKLYWTDSYIIRRSNLDGTNVEHLFTTPVQPRRIALDVLAGRIYWTDVNTIRRGNLDGTQVETLVEGLEKPCISLDPVHRQLYWTDSANLTIRRAGLDGTIVEVLVLDDWWVPPDDGDLLDIEDLALDLAEGKMYWVHHEKDYRVGGSLHYLYQANLDGSSISLLRTPRYGHGEEEVLPSNAGSIERWGTPAIAVMQRGPTETITAEVVRGLGLENPATSGLDPSYPNPFNRSTLIAYRLAAPGRVRLQVYNLLGQPLRTLVDEVQVPGSYRVEWDARDQRGSPVATGIYFSRLHYPGGVQGRQLLLLKQERGYPAPLTPARPSAGSPRW